MEAVLSLGLLGLLLQLACSATHPTKVIEPKLQPTCLEAVRLYFRPDSVHAPFREVAYLHSEVTIGGKSTMVTSLRNQAAELGATGVIFNPYLDRKPDVTGNVGDAVAILVPSDTARVNHLCVSGRQRWADSIAHVPTKTGMP
jgi:hypothetical protein